MATLCETCKHFARITRECKLALIKKTQDPNKNVVFCPDYFCDGVPIPDSIRDRIFSTFEEYFRVDAPDKDIIQELKLAVNSVYGLYVMPHIEKVIFNEPATIVFWSDDTKTVVKCDKNDIFDPEKGLAMAVAKKTLGTNASNSDYYDIFKKYLKEYEQNKKIDEQAKKINKQAKKVNNLIGYYK